MLNDFSRQPIAPQEFEKVIKYTRVYSYPANTLVATFTVQASIHLNEYARHPDQERLAKEKLRDVLRRRIYQNNTRQICETINKIEQEVPYSPTNALRSALNELRTLARYMEPGNISEN